MMFLVQVIVASVLVIMLAASGFFMLHRATRLSTAFQIIACSFVVYFLLTVPPIEPWLNNLLGSLPIAGLIKDLLLVFVSYGCVLSWGIWKVNRRIQILAVIVLSLHTIQVVWSWFNVRSHCKQLDFTFNECAQTVFSGAFSDITGIILLITIGYMTAWYILPGATWNTSSGQGIILFLFAIMISSVWAITYAVGIWELFRHGDYYDYQRIIRPPLAIASCFSCLLAILWSPLHRILSQIFFYLRIRPLLRILDLKLFSHHRLLRFPDVMDALGNMLLTERTMLSSAAPDNNAEQVASILLGAPAPDFIYIPTTSDLAIQKQWLEDITAILKSQRQSQC